MPISYTRPQGAMQLPIELSHPCYHSRAGPRELSILPDLRELQSCKLNAAAGRIQRVLNAGTVATLHGVIQSKADP
jgi:hypothetical protein